MTRSMPGSGSEDYGKNSVRYENNCYINVKVLFENVCVRVRVRPYPPFPTTPHKVCFIAIQGQILMDKYTLAYYGI